MTTTPCPVGWNLDDDYPIPILDNAVVEHGGALYSFGGVSRSTVVSTAYRYDGMSWEPIRAVPAARESSIAVSDGTFIYLLGGLDAFGTRTTSVYRYDPSAGTYTILAPFSGARFAPGAVYLDGKIYLMGGLINSVGMSDEVYTIASNTWSKIAAYPQAVGFITVVTRDGYIYGVGGVTGPNVASAKTYRYDPASNTWDDNAITDLPASRWGAAASLYRGSLIMAGGYVGGSLADSISTSAVAYSFGTNSWGEIAAMPQARARMAGDAMGSSFYAVGGRSANSTFTGTMSVQRFINACPNSVIPTATANAATSTAISATTTAAAHTTVPAVTATATVTRTPLSGPIRIYIPLVER